MLLVSHDRDFLDRTVTSIIAPEGEGKWIEYAGGYADMLAQRKADIAARSTIKAAGKPSSSNETPAAAKPASANKKLSYKQKYALETLPKRMEEAQTAIAKLEAVMADPNLYAKDFAKFEKTAAQLDKARAEMAGMEDEWLELEMLREEIEG